MAGLGGYGALEKFLEPLTSCEWLRQLFKVQWNEMIHKFAAFMAMKVKFWFSLHLM